jgi:hypothetical protein
VTAGTAVAAVFGGLVGVYTSSQSRLDVQDARIENIIVTLETLTHVQEGLEVEQKGMKEQVIRSEVSAEYLQEGQARLSKSVDTLSGEVRQLSQAVLARHKDD